MTQALSKEKIMQGEAQLLLKEAFKRFIKEQIGNLDNKPSVELGAWSLALLEVAHEIRLQQIKIQDQV